MYTQLRSVIGNAFAVRSASISKKRALVLRLAALTLAASTAATAAVPATHADTAPWRYGYYSVTISGSVNGWSFYRSGWLWVGSTITTTGTPNGVNPIEVCLWSGNPMTQASTGAIDLHTNSACQQSGTYRNLDLAYVSDNPSNGAVLAQYDRNMTCATGIDIFNATSSLTSLPFQVCGGYMFLMFKADGSMSGQINVTGTGGLYYSQAPYTATISGHA